MFNILQFLHWDIKLRHEHLDNKQLCNQGACCVFSVYVTGQGFFGMNWSTLLFSHVTNLLLTFAIDGML